MKQTSRGACASSHSTQLLTDLFSVRFSEGKLEQQGLVYPVKQFYLLSRNEMQEL